MKSAAWQMKSLRDEVHLWWMKSKTKVFGWMRSSHRRIISSVKRIYSELVRISLLCLSQRERGTATRWKEPADETLGLVLTYALSFAPHRREQIYSELVRI